MSFKTVVYETQAYTKSVAATIADALPTGGSVVLTGGTTAEKIYPFLALHDHDWSGLSVAFSDERCVPPDDPASNYKMARDLLLAKAGPKSVHRMRGEDEPAEAAASYSDEIADIARDGFDLLLLGMGADAHVGAIFPNTSPLDVTDHFCAPVDRPDGMKGLTLTPPAMLNAKKILLLVTGAPKAETVARAIQGNEKPHDCPVRLLADHPDVTFLLDKASADRI